MTEERRRILEMVRDGIITIEEGEELLKVVGEDDKGSNKFKEKLKEDLLKTKAELLKAKNRLVEEYEKIDMNKVKDKVKKGIDKVDDAVGKIDDAILKYGEKIFKKKSDQDQDVDDSEPLDPTKDRNISFYDKEKK